MTQTRLGQTLFCNFGCGRLCLEFVRLVTPFCALQSAGLCLPHCDFDSAILFHERGGRIVRPSHRLCAAEDRIFLCARDTPPDLDNRLVAVAESQFAVGSPRRKAYNQWKAGDASVRLLPQFKL
jgi:hypothetical protein